MELSTSIFDFGVRISIDLQQATRNTLVGRRHGGDPNTYRSGRKLHLPIQGDSIRDSLVMILALLSSITSLTIYILFYRYHAHTRSTILDGLYGGILIR